MSRPDNSSWLLSPGEDLTFIRVESLYTEVAYRGIKVKMAKAPAPAIMLNRLAARKGVDLNKAISRMGLESFFS
jgi:hypothetical protein